MIFTAEHAVIPHRPADTTAPRLSFGWHQGAGHDARLTAVEQLLTLRQRCDLLTGCKQGYVTAELNAAAAMLSFSPGRDDGQQSSPSSRGDQRRVQRIVREALWNS